MILDFENELLARVRGDVVPEGTAGAASGTEAGAVTLPKSIEPKPKEEGLLDKLKFWKKDEKKPEVKVPEVKPEATVEAPANDALGGNKDAPSGEVPSVLAVPIEINPALDLPAVSLPKIEPVKVEPIKVEPAKAEPLKTAPIKPATKPATNEEPFSLRIDRNLEAAPIEAAPSAKPKKVDVPPPPLEEEPGYFEKMLEKIGF